MCPQFRVRNDSSDVNNTSAMGGWEGGRRGWGVGLGGKSKFSNAVLLIFEDPRIV